MENCFQVKVKMKFQIRRLLWAFFLSGSCFLGTFLWSRSTQKNEVRYGAEPLAQVKNSLNNSQKKLVSSLQWLPLETGDSLFDGDTIKTSEKSQVEIIFGDASSSLKVDGNTTFVIQKSKDEINLDLKEGSIVVDAKSTQPQGSTAVAQPAIVLMADDKKLDLKGSKSQISKNKDSQVKLNILEGKTRVKNSDGSIKDLTSGNAVVLSKNEIKIKEEIKILSPNIIRQGDKTAFNYFVSSEGNQSVNFKWRNPHGKEETLLLTGPSKKQLKEIAVIPVGGDSIKANLPLGENYWQLITRDPSSKKITYESTLYRIYVQTKSSATLLFPKPDEVIFYDRLPYNVITKWQRPESAKSMNLEVSTSPNMSIDAIVLNQTVTNVTQFSLSFKAEGDYYWRISTRYDEIDRPIYSKVQKFKLSKKEPPKPPPVLTWLTTQEKQLYGDKPIMDLTWMAQTRKDDIAGWKIEVFDSKNTSLLKQDLKESKFQSNQISDGLYKIFLEALDKNGVSLTKIGPKNIEIAPYPLPTAPKINTSLLKKNVNNNQFYFENGIINLSWDNQPNMGTYEVEVFNLKSNRSQTLKTSKNNLQYSEGMTGLSPGNYQIKIVPVDRFNRRGPASDNFDFEVPSSTSMSAPKLKNLSIKASGQ